ncbi:hypothetical protein GQ53DRAFT_455858 [Thozetella sp. PMI_491]|nr:hypothetical protein GQ53DRAFT_455858 [Thozetella sp. PMI_491]
MSNGNCHFPVTLSTTLLWHPPLYYFGGLSIELYSTSTCSNYIVHSYGLLLRRRRNAGVRVGLSRSNVG